MVELCECLRKTFICPKMPREWSKFISDRKLAWSLVKIELGIKTLTFIIWINFLLIKVYFISFVQFLNNLVLIFLSDIFLRFSRQINTKSNPILNIYSLWDRYLITTWTTLCACRFTPPSFWRRCRGVISWYCDKICVIWFKIFIYFICINFCYF